MLGRIWRNTNINNSIMTTTNPPQSITASQFKPRFDTSTLDGKIAVMQEAKKVGHAYIQTTSCNWDIHKNPRWDWFRCTYNFPTEPKTKLIPFTRDTFPREAWIRFKADIDFNFRVLSYSNDSFRVGDTIKPYDRAMNDCEISLDHGKTWQPCGQVVEE